MAQDVRTNLAVLNATIQAYVVANNIATPTYTATYDDLTGLLNKIGKQVTITGNFYDRLPELDGDALPLGKTIEEWYQDLVKPLSFDRDGTNTMVRAKAGYRLPYYSFTMSPFTLKSTIENNRFNAVSNNQEAFISLSQNTLKKLSDSEALAKYGLKKELLKTAIAKIEACKSGATSYTTGSALTKGTYYKSGDAYGVALESRSATAGKTWANQVSEGYIQPLTLEDTLAIPTNTATGEAFIKKLKNLAEDISFVNDGNCMSGATIGAEEGVVCYIKKGILSVLDVDVIAGAFHQDKVALPVEIRVVDDFGDYDGNVYALIVDKRMIRLHPSYKNTTQQINAEGDFVNIYMHEQYTGFISMNTYCHVIKSE